MPITNCQRCGKKCQSGIGNPESRPFHRASQGLCVNCAITEFFKTTEPISSILEGLMYKTDQRILLSPAIQEQVGHILEAGNCDASLEEIDWSTVMEQWELPFPKSRRRAHSSTG